MSQIVNDDYPKKSHNQEMSDEQLKALAVAQYAGSETAKQKFPTEIIELPSKGLLYPKESALSSGKVEMKYMTAKEEDILTTQSYIKQGVVLDKLFRSMIVGNGEGLPIDYDELLSGDKNAIMIAARVLGYGKNYEVEIETPAGNKQKEIIDLTQLQDKVIDESLITPHVNEFELQLPASKRTIRFKLLSERDQRAVEAELKNKRKFIKGGTDPALTTRIARMIIAIDGSEDRKEITDFVNNYLLAIDSRAIRDHIKRVQPDVNMTITFIDEETGDTFDMSLPIGVNFFWPDA
jgi:hypothetical protein